MEGMQSLSKSVRKRPMSEDLFVITNVFVDGKNLSKLLRASAGLVVKIDVPRPVINAMIDKGTIKAASPHTGVKDKVIETLRHFSKGTDIPISQLRTIIKDADGASDTPGYYTQMLKNKKILKMKH